MEFVYDRGVLLVVTGDQSDISEALADPTRSALKTSLFERGAMGRRSSGPTDPKNEILAVDAESGKELWRSPAADTERLRGRDAGVDRRPRRLRHRDRTGLPGPRDGQGGLARRRPDRSQRTVRASPSRSCSRSAAAYLADSKQLRAFRLADGKALWTTPVTINHHKPPDVFLANGLVWAAAYDASTGKPAPALGLARMGVNGFDPETGKLVKQLDQTMTGPMGHDRCYRNRITTQYYINTRDRRQRLPGPRLARPNSPIPGSAAPAASARCPATACTMPGRLPAHAATASC